MTHGINRRATGALLFVLAIGITAPTLAQIRRGSRVEALSIDTWTMWIGRGETRVIVAGNGNTDLDCFVSDKASSRLLGVDDDGTDYCVVDFMKDSGGNVEIRIENLGRVWNRYELTIRSGQTASPLLSE